MSVVRQSTYRRVTDDENGLVVFHIHMYHSKRGAWKETAGRLETGDVFYVIDTGIEFGKCARVLCKFGLTYVFSRFAAMSSEDFITM